MKCSKCGAELSEDTKFCSYCDEKVVETNDTPPVTPTTEQEYKSEVKTENINNSPSPINFKSSNDNEIKKIWNKLDKFGNISVIGIAIFVLLGLIALVAGKTFAIIIAVVQIAITIVALLMKKGIIKVANSRIPILTLILSLVLLVPYIGLFNIDMSKNTRYQWSNIVLKDVIPEPKSNCGEIINNTNDYLALYVYKTNSDQYKGYIDSCKDKGFTADIEQSEDSFDAFNESGYKLSLCYDENDKEMDVRLNAPMKLGTLKWSDSEFAKLLPMPKSTVGKIEKDDKTGFVAYVGETTIEDYNAYVDACSEKGFTVESSRTDKHYSAKNENSYKITVDYQGNNIMCISVYEPEYKVSIEVECVENLIFSKYDVKVYVDDSSEGTINHGGTDTFDVTLKKGTHTIKFVNAEDDEVTGTVKFEISKNDILKFKISCTSSRIDVETISGTTTSDNSEETKVITLSMGADDLKGMNYQEAEKKFREMGFSDFKYDTVNTEDQSIADGDVCYIEITELFIGHSDFGKGDKYNSDSTITFHYYTYKAPETAKPVFYSTNDYETAKKGNTGVFAYKNKGGSYDVYWIINFDEGYVYWFTEGNGESTCDKVKIVSGDLNDKVIVTWHDGGDEWSWKLHFKYVNHPETLIVNDHNGTATEFTTTDLNDALSLRNSKTIKDY